MTAMHLPLICMAVWREWTECYAFVSSLYMTVRLGWTDCHAFVSYLRDSRAWCTASAIHVSHIYMAVRLGWTDCHAFVSSLYCSN